MSGPLHYKRQIADKFLGDMSRTRELYALLVIHGESKFDPASPGVLLPEAVQLRHVDRRDLAAFFFLEAAAKFEGFCFEAFTSEVRRWYEVTGTRADFIMGSSDRGTKNTMGWADAERLKERGKNLFPAYRFFGDFPTHVTLPVYNRLLQAKKIRNRVAHDPAMAHESIAQLAQQLGVPSNGMTVGRLLLDYPDHAPAAGRYFFIFLEAYEACARAYRAF